MSYMCPSHEETPLSDCPVCAWIRLNARYQRPYKAGETMRAAPLAVQEVQGARIQNGLDAWEDAQGEEA